MGKPNKDVEAINLMVSILDRVKNVLELMKEDKISVKEACKKNDISYAVFRRIVYSSDWEAYNDEEAHESFKKKFMETIPLYHWTEILFCDVMGLPRTPDSISKMPPDVRITMEKAVCSLTEREEKVIRLFYEDNYTKEEIAYEIGRSVERVRQIKAKAMRKLKHPSRNGYMVFGDEYYCNRRKAYEDVYENYVVEARKHEINKLDCIIMNKQKILNLDSVNSSKVPFRGDDEITELNLSIRSFNCLWRAGIHTINDLQNITVEELMKVRNLGKKSFDEIISIIEKFGLHLAKPIDSEE